MAERERADTEAAAAAAAAARERQAHDLAERQLYAAQIHLAQQEWQNANTGRALDLLRGAKPEPPGDQDLRGFEWHYLWHLCHAALLTLRHGDYVKSVAVSPDGTRLASAGAQAVVLWDAATGERLLTLPGQLPDAVAFSPDGSRVAASTANNSVTVWD